ncbi:MAG TPA: hypothetical protein VNW29_06180 [Candidatus Sulfotelmatobacter sp.]|nr:hypothetical protein [Candidatus Sulfotelmatobacter sp.]
MVTVAGQVSTTPILKTIDITNNIIEIVISMERIQQTITQFGSQTRV